MGRAGRRVGAKVDLVRETGIRHALRRLGDPARVEHLARTRRHVYERIWREGASAVGAELVDVSNGFLELRKSDAWTRVWEQWVMLDDAVTLRLALDRRAVNCLLTKAEIPIPDHLEFDFRDLAPAVAFLDAHGDSAVVKPASGTGGSVGVTCGVRRVAQLRRAAVRAARSDPCVLIERQAEGGMYRFLFLDGELLDVVRRFPPTLRGDGRSTIDDLIAAENERRMRAAGDAALDLLSVDLDCLFTLAKEGLRLASVPKRGESVQVKTATNENRVEDNVTVREPLSDELVSEARAAAAAVGVRLAGIDLVTSDLGRSLSAGGGVVLEVNGTPGLHYHYLVAEPERATPVAVPILRKLLGLPA